MRKIFKIVFIVVAILAGGYAFFKCVRPLGIEPWMVREWLPKVFYYPVVQLLRETVLTWEFAIVVVFTLLMERFFPANPDQKTLSVSFRQDLVWFFYETMMQAIILTTYIYWLTEIYKKHFNFLTIETVAGWPDWSRFIVGVLLLDFLYWLQHYLNHKVPWLWQMHTVHHSQKEINFFTDFRYHIFEYIIRHTILVIPFLILKVNTPTIIVFAIFRTWYSRFYHGNIRTNMGPLRYILVTPQSHRVHHSKLAQHHDLNFGSLFSIWDFLFGTQYRGFDEYPPTGITDEEFPHENESRFPQILFMPIIQLVYPFRVIGRQIRQMILGKKR